jgi:hypothetical protein
MLQGREGGEGEPASATPATEFGDGTPIGKPRVGVGQAGREETRANGSSPLSRLLDGQGRGTTNPSCVSSNASRRGAGSLERARAVEGTLHPIRSFMECRAAGVPRARVSVWLLPSERAVPRDVG